MKPPFLGVKILTSILLEDIEPLINRDVLFASRWQMRGNLGAEEWGELKNSKAAHIYEKIFTMCRARNVIRPVIAYGYFETEKKGNSLFVRKSAKVFRFDLPRERRTPNRCLADYFGGGFAVFQLATVGSKVAQECTRLFKEKKFSDDFYLKGFSAEACETLAEYGHQYIRKELGVGIDVGRRFSPGYPVFPSLFDQKKIVRLLEADKIGVTLTETRQLVPEHSTTAIISIDPKAEYFTP